MTTFGGQVPRWPALPQVLKNLLNDIEAETEDEPRHPRPWDLASLPDELREVVWGWLPKAVAWINECFAWQPENVIPPCWPRHPHLAIDLAVLAFGRELASRSTHTRDLIQWHEDLQATESRMGSALGLASLTECQRGFHAPRPASYELELFALYSNDCSEGEVPPPGAGHPRAV